MGKPKKEFGLGRGLSSLISTKYNISEETEYSLNNSSVLIDNFFQEIEISKIRFNPLQPRKEFDEKQLEELASSIKENGIIQPITVRKTDLGYQIISGERRTRAAIKVGLKTVPAYIIKVEEDFKLLELALIENLQREDLNPIDLANAYKKLIEEFNYTQEELAQKIGKDRSTVTNILRLLKLPFNIQDSLKKEEISLGHAKLLLSIENQDLQEKIWKKILTQKLSVRQTENIVNQLKHKNQIASDYKKSVQKDENIEDITKKLVQILGTKVSIVHRNHKGKIIIQFFNDEDFQRIIETILSRSPL